MQSTAVASNRVAAVIGYNIDKGSSAASSGNLPQRIALIGEANTANQSGLDTTPYQLTNSQQAGKKYGWGSPLHLMALQLFPVGGGGTSVPVWAMALPAPSGAAARVQTITVTGTATGNGTHYVKVAGRTNVAGKYYAVNIVTDDDNAAIAAKIKDAINNVLSAPISATNTTNLVTATNKAKGASGGALMLEMDTNNNDLGITYAIAQTVAGSGTPDIQDALDLFQDTWYTIVANGLGAVSSTLDTLEAFNGVPGIDNPTGRYAGIIMKPFMALTGTVADDPSSVTSGRKDECTNLMCPAPLSHNLHYEVAAAYVLKYAQIAQDKPHLDVMDQTLDDITLPDADEIPAMQDYNERDRIVQLGCSTAMIRGNKYVIKDFVTTYRPDGENPPQFRWARILNIDWNVFYTYYLQQQAHVIGNVLANDSDAIDVEEVIKPKDWKAIVATDVIENLVSRGMLVKAEQSIATIQSQISSVNPDRFDTIFDYTRSGVGRIAPTNASANFNYGAV
jgi:phage tail sheath gpL-like